MADNLRKTGLEIIGDVPWGTHFCQFYRTKEDLSDVLTPYFKAGLENNEFCMWVTSEPLTVDDARRIMRKSLPDFDKYAEKGQIEIIPYTDWYVKDGVFEADRVLAGWVEKLDKALAAGFDGLRLTGNTFWLEDKDWNAFTDYEEAVNRVIGRYRMLALCTYSLDRCNASEVIDVVNNHQFALIRRNDKWELMESAEHRRAAETLRQSREDLNRAQAVAHTGSWRLDVRRNQLLWSDETYRIFGVPAGTDLTYERFLEAVHPSDREHVDRQWQAALRGEPYDIEHRIIADGTVKWVGEKAELDFDRDGSLLGGFGTVQDITERKKAEEALKRSNENLEQFAYVASHDLQEPLRIMASYSQLLEQRYREKIDTDGKEFINYIVDAAKRMQKLITDLLAYSRVGKADTAGEVDGNSAIDKVLRVMDPLVEECGAVVTHDPLPALPVNESYFIQVIQNLVGNALKFRGDQPPRVHVGAEKRDSEWLFSVRDNGIGIEPKYHDRIFQVFQRLHGRDKYPGTGIGLSICRKIVEMRGGRIWVESAPGAGSTFYFTVPVKGEETLK